MSILQEFKAFALKGNVVDLAAAVVIGNAFGKIVSSIVGDVVMPVVGALIPGGDWRSFTVTSLNIKLGSLLGSIVDFIIVALVLFLVMVKMMGVVKKKSNEPAPAPTTKKCTECLEEIPIEAKRCRACTTVVA